MACAEIRVGRDLASTRGPRLPLGPAAWSCPVELQLVPAPLALRLETVLLLDDEPETLRCVPAALQGVCRQCLACRTLAEALEAARRHPPTLLICGQALGVAAWEAVAVQACLQRLPVIFLSRGQLPDVIRRTQPLGGAYYVRRACAAEVLPKLAGQVLAVQGRCIPQPRGKLAACASGV